MSFDDAENQFPEDADGHRDCRQEIARLTEELKITRASLDHTNGKRTEALRSLGIILELLVEIRDKWIPSLERDAREPDKTLCNTLSIRSRLARVVPEHTYPKTGCTHGSDSDDCPDCRH